MRGVIWGLLACNVLFLVWQLLQTPSSAPNGLALERGAAGSTLYLLSETSPAELRPLVQGLAETAALTGEPPPYCVEIGAFTDESASAQFSTRWAGARQLRLERRSVLEAVSYRVYSQPQATRQLALEYLVRLREAITENGLGFGSFLISDGELNNGISLGLFSEHANALEVEARLVDLGFDVAVREESRMREGLWLLSDEFASAQDFNSWWLEIAPVHPNLQGREKLCETIAQPF